MNVTARSMAYHVLHQVFADRAYTNLALKQLFDKNHDIDEREKALCTEIVYGTVQRQMTIDLLAEPFSKRKLSDLNQPVLTILRMTIYQLAFLDKIPGYAAIHEAVELAKVHEPKAQGFVNGVLRSYMRFEKSTEDRLKSLERQTQTFAERMSIRYSFPIWLVKKLRNDYGDARTEAILQSFNHRAHMSMRVNAMSLTRHELINELVETYGEDSAVPSLLSEFGVRMLRGLNIENSPLYKSGKMSIQDEGAMLVAPLVRPKENRKILDMCAAPGTKTTHLAELQQDQGQITACDIHVHKLKLIRQARDRLSLSSIETKLADGRILAETDALKESFDAILLDAPCSGFGVLRHRPDIRYKRKERDIQSLMALQYELLSTAVQLIRSGGVIVYSTCTILNHENEQLVDTIVRDFSSQLTWDPIESDIPDTAKQYVTDKGLVLTPELFGTDGFYMTRLRKK